MGSEEGVIGVKYQAIFNLFLTSWVGDIEKCPVLAIEMDVFGLNSRVNDNFCYYPHTIKKTQWGFSNQFFTWIQFKGPKQYNNLNVLRNILSQSSVSKKGNIFIQVSMDSY